MGRDDRRKMERMARIAARRIKKRGGPDFLAGMPAEEWCPKVGDKVLVKVDDIVKRKNFMRMVEDYQQFIYSLDENTPYTITSIGMNGQVYGIDANSYFQIWKSDLTLYKGKE